MVTQELKMETSRFGVALALLKEPYIGGNCKMRDYAGVRVFKAIKTENSTTKKTIAGKTKSFFQDDIASYNAISKIRPSGTKTEILAEHGGSPSFCIASGARGASRASAMKLHPKLWRTYFMSVQFFSINRYEATRRLGEEIALENREILNGNKNIRTKFWQYCIRVAKVANINKNKAIKICCKYIVSIYVHSIWNEIAMNK